MAWKIIENELTNTEFSDDPDFFTVSKPDTLWRIDELIDGGTPFLPLFAELEKIALVPATHYPELRIYNPRAKYEELQKNGISILSAIEGKVRQEKNGMYLLSAKMLYDEKTAEIKGKSIVKVPIKYHDEIKNQLFRVNIPEKNMDESGIETIEIEAPHIFYDLADKCLDDVRPTNLACQAALEYIYNGVFGGWQDGENEFVFSSDIYEKSTSYFEGVSLAGAIIGEDNSIINRYGGALYRDNFSFSINREMQGHKETGVIEYANNMKSIEFAADYSECITQLIAKDNFGNRKIITNENVPSEEFPHHITKAVTFVYDEENRIQFESDALAYYDNYKQADVNIKVNIADLPDTDIYKGFKQLEDFEVGDKVIVYHKNLGINFGNLEIISTVQDITTLRKTEVEIGTFKNAISRDRFMPDTATTSPDKQAEANANEIYNANTRFMASSIRNMEMFAISELEKRTINELEGY